MVGTGQLSCISVKCAVHFIAFLQNAVDVFNMMQRLLVRRFLHIGDIRGECVVPYSSGISALSAAFRIEACLIENDIAFVLEFADSDAILEETDDLCFAGGFCIACEHTLVGEIHEVLGLCVHGLLIAACFTRSALLLSHLFVKAFKIDCVSCIFCDFRSQFLREAISVIKTEDNLTRKNFCVSVVLQLIIEQVFTVGQCLVECFFLILNQACNIADLIFQIRIVIIHHIRNNLDQLIHEGTFNTELDAIADSPSQNSS